MSEGYKIYISSLIISSIIFLLILLLQYILYKKGKYSTSFYSYVNDADTSRFFSIILGGLILGSIICTILYELWNIVYNML